MPVLQQRWAQRCRNWRSQFTCRLPDTSTRMNNMLEVMAKLKNARNLDVRQSGMVDSAYFAVKVGVVGGPAAQEGVLRGQQSRGV